MVDAWVGAYFITVLVFPTTHTHTLVHNDTTCVYTETQTNAVRRKRCIKNIHAIFTFYVNTWHKCTQQHNVYDHHHANVFYRTWNMGLIISSRLIWQYDYMCIRLSVKPDDVLNKIKMSTEEEVKRIPKYLRCSRALLPPDLTEN